MDPIYVCGHRNPDTDSVVSAMAFAALHNALGDNAYVAAMQGAPNDETQFLLDRFGFQAPTLLTNVRTQVRDIDYDRPPTLGTSVPISHAWAVLREDENLSAVPVTNEDGTLYGMLTAGGIAEKDMESITKPEVRDVPIFNLLSALEGHIINNEEDTFDTISGEVVPLAYGAFLSYNRDGGQSVPIRRKEESDSHEDFADRRCRIYRDAHLCGTDGSGARCGCCR